jgi:hypothetical protein
MSENLNEVFEEAMEDALVITVPIDDTLSNSGEAADAAAVGAALALKANASDIASIKVNEQQADNQGQILLSGDDVPVSDTDTRTIAAAIGAAEGRTAADIHMSGADSTTISAKIAAVEDDATRNGAEIPLTDALGAPSIAEAVGALQGAVKTVNGEAADSEGNVSIQRVNLAGNLETAFKASSEGAFLQRSSGGAAAVVDGDANLLSVMGNSVKTGYVAEAVVPDVQPVSEESELAVSINKATWRSAVAESGTYEFKYASSGTTWKLDGTAVTLADYGITIISGTEANNDKIVITYVAEIRGTITPAFANDSATKRFVSTGWNLYQSSNGYAKVVKYSNEYGYRIDGAFTSLQFATTYGGSRSAITPNSAGVFQVPSDGYVFVSGGNGTTTAIYPTWSDWVNGTPNEFQAFSLTAVDLSSVLASYFQNGMFQVGDTRDEIDIANGQAINRIDRMDYSDENLATAIATGRAYEYDEDYIYLVRATPSTHSITLSGTFTVSDHGTEYFEGSDVDVYAKCTYGMNLKNKLERDTLTVSQQTLSDAEKDQVRTNIGAAGAADIAPFGYQFPDYTNILLNNGASSAALDYTATENCWLNVWMITNATRTLQINGVTVATTTYVTISSTKYYLIAFSGFLKAGDRVAVTGGNVRALVTGLKR